jgi:hypothetical protein
MMHLVLKMVLRSSVLTVLDLDEVDAENFGLVLSGGPLRS